MDTSIRSAPDDTYLIPDIRNGGIVSIAIFIVIYVDPITTQSNINTNQTFSLAIDRYNSTLARFKSESILGSSGQHILFHVKPAIQKLQYAYEKVINSLIDKSVIPYYPNIYPVPFMIIKRYRVRFYTTRVLFYALTYPDLKDFNKFAIYVYEGLIENSPDLLPGVIGHEISHVIALKGKVELTKEDLALILKDRLSYINAKEKSAEDTYYCFTKEIQSKVKEWDTYSRRQEIEDSIIKDAELVDQEYFDKRIFGNRLEEYKQFVKFNLNKIGVL